MKKDMLQRFIVESLRDDDYEDYLADLADQRAQSEEYVADLMGHPDMAAWKKDMAAYRTPEEKRREREEKDFERQLALMKRWKEEEDAAVATRRAHAQRKKEHDLKNPMFDDEYEDYLSNKIPRNLDDEESGDGKRKYLQPDFSLDDWDL